MDEETKKELFSLPSIATFAGLGLAVWTLVEQRAGMTFTVLAVVVCILVGYLVALHRKNTDLKRQLKEMEDSLTRRIQSLSDELFRESQRRRELAVGFHKLTHRSRDYLSDARTSTSSTELQERLVAAIKMALTTASTTFSQLTGRTCSASVMTKQRDGRFGTWLYCQNANPQRESKPSAPIAATQGIVGRAVTTGDVVAWIDTDHTFFRTRPDHSLFYRSGLCVPFKKSYDYLGILNLDSLDTDAFDYTQHKEIGAAFADQLGLLLECHDTMGGHRGNT
ncbi:MAG: GAF domain-containing protein [Rubrivivax sp.]|nr:GAF domain-containing protein [Rubrivivax sp.]